MRRPSNPSRVLGILAFACLAWAGCHRDQDGVKEFIPSPQSGLSFDGAYTGTTSQGSTITFSVSNDVLTTGTVGLSICGETPTRTFTVNAPLNGNQTSFQSGETQMTVEFSSNTAGGTVNATDLATCPDTISVTFQTTRS